jgi:DNA-binding transcriptional ArsR family regulator
VVVVSVGAYSASNSDTGTSVIARLYIDVDRLKRARSFLPIGTCGGVSTSLLYNHMVVYQLEDRDVDRVFRALADATRRDIFQRVIGDGLSVSTLAHDYEMSFAAVQKHVSVLERAALVTKERHGREQIVHGNLATLRRVATLLAGFEQIWIGRATRIAEILGEEGSEV